MDLPVAIRYRLLQEESPKVSVYYPFVVGLANPKAPMKSRLTYLDSLTSRSPSLILRASLDRKDHLGNCSLFKKMLYTLHNE